MIPRLNSSYLPWTSIYAEYCLGNKPFCLSSDATSEWSCRTWSDNGSPNYDVLKQDYGNAVCPVLKGNNESVMMPLSEYLDICKSSDAIEDVYLKDWHFQKEFGCSIYKPPLCLSNDWVNREDWTSQAQNPFDGDYRFVYIGKSGTWTRFHCDVMCSHSWSANICGRKLWYFVPPGSEKHFAVPGGFIEDIREKRSLWNLAGVIEFIQEEGETMFVPSNWHHQVHNLCASISINHNFINSSNIYLVWEFLLQRLEDVKKELSDVTEFTLEELEEKYQLILLADARLSFPSFYQLLCLVRDDRSNHNNSLCYVCPIHLHHVSQCFLTHSCVDRFSKICECTTTKCTVCSMFSRSLDLSVVCDLLDKFKIQVK